MAPGDRARRSGGRIRVGLRLGHGTDPALLGGRRRVGLRRDRTGRGQALPRLCPRTAAGALRRRRPGRRGHRVGRRTDRVRRLRRLLDALPRRYRPGARLRGHARRPGADRTTGGAPPGPPGQGRRLDRVDRPRVDRPGERARRRMSTRLSGRSGVALHSRCPGPQLGCTAVAGGAPGWTVVAARQDAGALTSTPRSTVYETEIHVIGNVADVPRHNRTANGSVTNFRMAPPPRRWDEESKTFVDGATLWIDVACWGELGGNVAR